MAQLHWADALPIAVERTGVPRYEFLTSEQNPDAIARERYRAHVVKVASMPIEEFKSAHAPKANPNPAPAYPPLHEMVGNALKAGVKFLASGLKLVDQHEHDRRLSICRGGCEFYDAAARRCKACGCIDEWKAWLKTEKCPKRRW